MSRTHSVGGSHHPNTRDSTTALATHLLRPRSVPVARVYVAAQFLLTCGLPTLTCSSFLRAMEPPQSLQNRSLDNLVAYTKLLGYVRYFYPSNEAYSTDWDKFAITGVSAIEHARSPDELAARLEELFRPIAPLVRVYTLENPSSKDELTYQPPKDPSFLKVIAWRHHGVGLDYSMYQSIRESENASGPAVPGSFLDPSRLFRADLGGGLRVVMPCALYLDGHKTLPSGEANASVRPRPNRPGSATSEDDRTERVAAVALAWNVLQHFYPYFDVVQTDWPAALREALAAASNDTDEHAFLATLRKMIAALDDGHGWVAYSGEDTPYALPIAWAWIENHLVITAVMSNDAIDLKPGDVVTKVGGVSALDALRAEEAYISAATPQWRRLRALRGLAAGKRFTGVDVEVRRGEGETRTVGLLRTVKVRSFVESRPPQIAEVEPGVFYVDLDRVEESTFVAALPKLTRAKGIVFDLRGYPTARTGYIFPIPHLIDEPVDSPRWMHPVATRPDQTDVQFKRSHWTVEPREPRLRAKVAYITDASAISAAETHMAIIEHYKLAPIRGEPTAGTNGDVNPFVLPGGYHVVWTGLRVEKHDGSRFHGVGVLPSVPCSRTIEGVRAGRDELLERAIEIVRP